MRRLKSLLGRLRPRRTNEFEHWQERNPSGSFKDYFTETVQSQLKDGRPHATLGGNLQGAEFGVSGQGIFTRLQRCGLKPGDVCVDYGCGTLRVGFHLINYLQPGAYWGLEIADFLLDEGRKLLGKEILAEKRPHLRVISPEVVAEATAAKPDMLFSASVLIHVHPDDLPEYIDNVMTIIGSDALAIVTGKWNRGETIQYSGRSWAHSISGIEALVRERAGEMTILREEDYAFEELGRTGKRGAFHITRAGKPTRS